jgi:type IV pilus assembly protein PilO
VRQLGIWIARVLRWVVPFLLVFFAAGEFFLQPKSDELYEEQVTLTRLTDEYVNKKRQAENLDAFRAQLLEIGRLNAQLTSVLPDKFDPNFVHLHDAVRRRSLRVEEARLADEQRSDFYARLPMRIKVSARFHELGAFAADLERAPGCLVLQDLSLDPSPTPGQVTMQAWVLAHRYLTDEEIAAQRKKAAKGEKK